MQSRWILHDSNNLMYQRDISIIYVL
uniref:Uncharacterized protein n=1 Tax=Arundo donax TaxID=35708 RepID=A0A0A8YCX6_ARUDO